jgi:hypothetical protein
LYDGRIELTDSPLGGLRATLILPATADAALPRYPAAPHPAVPVCGGGAWPAGAYFCKLRMRQARPRCAPRQNNHKNNYL